MIRLRANMVHDSRIIRLLSRSRKLRCIAICIAPGHLKWCCARCSSVHDYAILVRTLSIPVFALCALAIMRPQPYRTGLCNLCVSVCAVSICADYLISAHTHFHHEVMYACPIEWNDCFK